MLKHGLQDLQTFFLEDGSIQPLSIFIDSHE
jgi:hypothetical protein